MTARLPWSARLAPLGVPTVDGRVLNPDSPPILSDLVSLIWPGHTNPKYQHDIPQCGRVDTLTCDGQWMVCAGVVWDTTLITAMQAGLVFPELSLLQPSFTTRTPEGFTRYSGGTVGAVAAGQSPAWPDSRFILEES